MFARLSKSPRFSCIRQSVVFVASVAAFATSALAPRVAVADFTYSDFSSTAGLTMNGNAAQSANLLRLTPNQGDQSGTAWYTASKAHLADGFETTFTFQMGGDLGGGGGADGMAFVIQDSNTLELGSGGSGLGYEGIPRSLAVELDTFGFSPETGNHVSIQTAGSGGNSAADSNSLGLHNAAADLNDAAVHTLRVVYRPGFMLVFLDSIPAPVLNIAIDLQNVGGDSILDGSGDAWVGFSAATGGAYQTHDVTSWSFDETSAAPATGGCCLGDTCVNTNARNCGAVLGGYYGGDGTSCETLACVGACCFGFECWFDAPVDDCINATLGTFMGVGSSCFDVSCLGACCTQNGECVLADQADCENVYGGAFHGAGTSCTPFPCYLPLLGACCVEGTCELSTEFTCGSQLGTWYGLGTQCNDISCGDTAGPFGACCQAGSATPCVESVTQPACEHFNGVYNGDGSLCENANCTSACSCEGATVIGSNTFMSDSTIGAPACTGATCGEVIADSPAKVYFFTADIGGLALIDTCNNASFDSVISVHSGCPMTEANRITCDNGSCQPGASLSFCCEAGDSFYIRVGGRNGTSGNYDLFAFVIPASISEGPFQNPANGHWYYLTSLGNWVATEELAISKGGHLATINDAAENEWIRQTFVPGDGFDRSLLIGINDAAVEGTFIWSSGEPFTYANWISGQPDDAGGEDYGIMFPNGEWNDQSRCANVNDGVIEVESVQIPAVVAGPILNPANCHEYYLTEPGTWFEVKMRAELMGGNLATIDNAAENEWVRAMMANYNNVERLLWLGLSDRDVEGTYEWMDGSPVAYINWAPFEPNNIGDEDYVSMVNPQNGEWNDARSGNSLAGVIEISTPCTLGDMNCSNSVTTADVPLFVQALLQPGPFAGCDIDRADMNGDTFENGRDVQGFVEALITP